MSDRAHRRPFLALVKARSSRRRIKDEEGERRRIKSKEDNEEEEDNMEIE